MGVYPRRGTGRRGQTGTVPGQRAGGDLSAPHHRAAPAPGGLGGHGNQTEGPLPGERSARHPEEHVGLFLPVGEGGAGDDEAGVAGQDARSGIPGEAAAEPAAPHPVPAHRHLLPAGRGGNLLHPRPVRRGQDGPPADHIPLCRGRRRHHRGLRRAGRRGRGNHPRVPGAGRPQNGRIPDEPDGHHLQHLLYARGGPRGLDLYRDFDRRVLPADRAQGSAAGGQHLPLGSGAPRVFGPSRGDPRRGGLPGLPGEPDRRGVRAGGAGAAP